MLVCDDKSKKGSQCSLDISRLSLCACTCRAVRTESDESQHLPVECASQRVQCTLHVSAVHVSVQVFLLHVLQVKLAETPCMDGHPCNPQDFNSTRELAPICAHIALNSLYLARIGRPHFVWILNVWDKSRGKRLARFRRYIKH